MLTPSPEAEGLLNALTGMKWPHVNEDELRRAAGYYQAVAHDFTELDDELVKLAHTIDAEFEGRAADAFAAFAQVLAGGGDSFLSAAADQANNLADTADDTATKAEYTKWMMLGQLIELLAEMAFEAAVWWVPGLGEAAAAEVAFLTALVRILCRQLLKSLLKAIATHVAISASLAAAMDGIIQLIQIKQGHRGSYDTDLLGQAVGFGAVQGLISGPLSLAGAGLGKYLGNRFGTGLGAKFAAELGGLLKKLDMPPEASAAFAKDLAKLLAATDQHLSKGFGKGFGRDTLATGAGAGAAAGAKGAARGGGSLASGFANKVGDLFAKHGAAGLEKDAARDFGHTWAEQLVKHWDGAHSAKTIGGPMAAALKGKADAPAVHTFAHDVPEMLAKGPGFQGDWRFKAGLYGTDMLTQGVAQNLAEGSYNAMTGEGFDTSWDTFLAGFLTAGVSHGGRHLFVHPAIHWSQHHFDLSGLKTGFSTSALPQAHDTGAVLEKFFTPGPAGDGGVPANPLPDATTADATTEDPDTAGADTAGADMVDVSATHAAPSPDPSASGQSGHGTPGDTTTDTPSHRAAAGPTAHPAANTATGARQHTPHQPVTTESRPPTAPHHHLGGNAHAAHTAPHTPTPQHATPPAPPTGPASTSPHASHVSGTSGVVQPAQTQNAPPPADPTGTTASGSPLGHVEMSAPPPTAPAHQDAGWGFEVGRSVSGDGVVWTDVRVRVHLRAGGGASEEVLAQARESAFAGVEEYFNVPGHRLPNGDRLRVGVEFTDDPAGAHHVVTVHEDPGGVGRADAENWFVVPGVDARHTVAHEVGHLLGLRDQYRELSVERRVVYDDASLMGGQYLDSGGRLIVEPGTAESAALAGGLRVMPRDLDVLGHRIDAAWRRAVSQGLVRDMEHGGGRGRGGSVPLEVRERVARAHREGGSGFPAHWTTDEVFHAARQVFLEHRRTTGAEPGAARVLDGLDLAVSGSAARAPFRAGAFRGTYQGVRVEGTADASGVITDVWATGPATGSEAHPHADPPHPQPLTGPAVTAAAPTGGGHPPSAPARNDTPRPSTEDDGASGPGGLRSIDGRGPTVEEEQASVASTEDPPVRTDEDGDEADLYYRLLTAPHPPATPPHEERRHRGDVDEQEETPVPTEGAAGQRLSDLTTVTTADVLNAGDRFAAAWSLLTEVADPFATGMEAIRLVAEDLGVDPTLLETIERLEEGSPPGAFSREQSETRHSDREDSDHEEEHSDREDSDGEHSDREEEHSDREQSEEEQLTDEEPDQESVRESDQESDRESDRESEDQQQARQPQPPDASDRVWEVVRAVAEGADVLPATVWATANALVSQQAEAHGDTGLAHRLSIAMAVADAFDFTADAVGALESLVHQARRAEERRRLAEPGISRSTEQAARNSAIISGVASSLGAVADFLTFYRHIRTAAGGTVPPEVAITAFGLLVAAESVRLLNTLHTLFHAAGRTGAFDGTGLLDGPETGPGAASTSAAAAPGGLTEPTRELLADLDRAGMSGLLAGYTPAVATSLAKISSSAVFIRMFRGLLPFFSHGGWVSLLVAGVLGLMVKAYGWTRSFDHARRPVPVHDEETGAVELTAFTPEAENGGEQAAAPGLRQPTPLQAIRWMLDPANSRPGTYEQAAHELVALAAERDGPSGAAARAVLARLGLGRGDLGYTSERAWTDSLAGTRGDAAERERWEARVQARLTEGAQWS